MAVRKFSSCKIVGVFDDPPPCDDAVRNYAATAAFFPAARRRLDDVPTHTGRHFPPRTVRLNCRKTCQNSDRKAFGSSLTRLQKVSIPSPNFSRPDPVQTIDCKYEKRASRARQRLRRVYHLEGDLRVKLFFGVPVRATPCLHIGGACCCRYRCCLGDRGGIFVGEFRFHPLPRRLAAGDACGSVRRLRDATGTHPGWRYADDALLKLTSSVALGAWLLCLADARRVYSSSHGSKRVISLPSTDANLSRRCHSSVM